MRTSDPGFIVGARVAARYSDGGWYTGTIASVGDGDHAVDYDDGSRTDVDAADLRLLSKTLRLAVGDRVLAVWQSCTMYPATVQKVGKGDALLAWEDGSEPSTVALDLITMRPPDYGAAAASESFTIWKDGSIVGSIEADGTIWMEGSVAGKYEPDGNVRVGGSVAGRIEGNGTVRKGGSIVGSIEADGTVYRDGSIIGSVEADGTVYRDGSAIGEVPGAPPRQIAGFFFFYFLEE